MLFDPRYEIDVIKLFCDKARITNVVVKWPGTFINGKVFLTLVFSNKFLSAIGSLYTRNY